MKPLGVGVVGLGFMGRTHVAAYAAAQAAGHPCNLVMVCDPKPQGLGGELTGGGNFATASGRLFDPAQVRGTTRPDELFADPAVQIVSICTPTDTHVALAAAALRAGKHVLVEKPVALDADAIRALARTAAASDRLCMPAMCMRYWPGWDWLREQIRNQTFGKVRSATFTRIGAMPGWGGRFYADESKSGGAIFDLHIHDTDFVSWCFGRPAAVRTCGEPRHFTTAYEFPQGPAHVTAEGAWDLAPAAGFRMRYLVVCDLATLEFELGRTPQLLVHGERRSEAVPLSALLGYDFEIRDFVQAVATGRHEVRATLDDAARVTEILAAERASLLA